MRARDNREEGCSGRDAQSANRPLTEAAAPDEDVDRADGFFRSLESALEGLARDLRGDEDDTKLQNLKEVTHRLLHVSAEDDAENQAGHSSHLDDFSLRRHIHLRQDFTTKLWDSTPVEKRIFKSHTCCFGLCFTTLRMERLFLDGHARLHKNIVYLGYVLVVVVTIYRAFLQIFQPAVKRSVCSDEIPFCDYESISSPADVWQEVLAKFGKYYFSFILPLLLIGSGLHWYIHKSNRVKEKWWAFLVVFIVYSLILNGIMLQSIHLQGYKWANNMLAITMIYFSIFCFFSGTPTFTMFFVYFVLFLCAAVTAHFTWGKPATEKMYGSDSEEVVYLDTEYLAQTISTVALGVLYLVGSYLMEIAKRKQFLQRMLMHSQQKQIIREKTKNENLQRQLLENMLPTSIVDQLQRQNFTVSSWDQLRALSHRHFGVSIMFAELENFTAFSSEVDPPRVMEYLNDMFSIFDDLCDQHDVYKVETVGDQYVAAVGVVTGEMLTEDTLSMRRSQSLDENQDEMTDNVSIRDAACSNTAHMIEYAQAIIEGSRDVVVPPEIQACPLLRVGIHTGSCMSGIVGTKNFRFCLFGDTMNTAARMEQTSMAECIHVTEDVVSLAPGYSWKKLKKLNVKGKGKMQTYLLHVSYEDVDATGSPEACTFFVGDDLEDEDDEDIGSEFEDKSISSTIRLMRSMTRVRPDGNAYQDVFPVKDDVFRHHTKWFGLVFKKLDVERAFLDAHARLYKNDVYLGYCLYVGELLLNIFIGCLFYHEDYRICSNPLYEEFCITEFGRYTYDLAKQPKEEDPIPYMSIMNVAYIRIPPVSAFVLALLIAYGILSHWVMHKCERLKEKSWALVNVWCVFILSMVLMHLTIVLLRLPDKVSAQWPDSLLFHGMIQVTILVLCTGTPFVLNFLWWMLATALYYGLAIPVIRKDQQRIDEDPTYTPVLATLNFWYNSNLLFYYSVIVLIGSYLNDIVNRKRFLQGILLLKQQDQIIRVKTKNERTQRTFLENILPPSLVGELQMQQDQDFGASAYRRLKSLSTSHVGVSMLFADLVGFTAFSSQVDPFKVMVFLNDLFHVFDELCDQHNVYKLETIGDCYVATVGLVTGKTVSWRLQDVNSKVLNEQESMSGKEGVANGKDLINFAKAMLIESRKVMKPEVNTPAIMRIGIHTGSCISGIVGTKILKFCLFGDMVITAAEMEKLGTADCIRASQDLVELVPEEAWENEKKNRDDSIEKQTYLLHVL